MTRTEWQATSADVRSELEDWRHRLSCMCRVLNAWAENPPDFSDHSIPGNDPSSSEYGGDLHLNDRLIALEQRTATLGGARRGEELIGWIDACMDALRAYDDAFEKSPCSLDIEEKALKLLNEIARNYEHLDRSRGR